MSVKPRLPNWLVSLPNKLTLGRIAAIPILLVVYPWNWVIFNYLCTVIFFAAALTDFFDGFLARRYNMVSRLGATLDPIADKLLVTAAIVLLTNAGQLPAILAALLICREVAVSGLRVTAMEQGFSLDVDYFGKLKTLLLDFAIVCLMPQAKSLHTVGILAVWVALFVSYYSAYRYWLVYWEKPISTKSKDIE